MSGVFWVVPRGHTPTRLSRRPYSECRRLDCIRPRYNDGELCKFHADLEDYRIHLRSLRRHAQLPRRGRLSG